ncbi:transcriptional regulator [Mycobacterium sp. GA-1841]|uniref:transcriptional regulator n=1 Tax=Mycobacterium sp. GA-1841 TaxID=1834154 RepID=UPI001C37C888|nr:transcriptional regulator [Mycobacterium sp. GA-1841]
MTEHRTPATVVYVIQNRIEPEQALLDALTSIGLTAIKPTDPDTYVDIWVDVPGGGTIAIEVKYASLASVDGLQEKLDRWNRRTPEAADGQPITKVLVANRITADARSYLRNADWGWLDLRGHMHVAGPGLFIDADIEPTQPHAHRTADPFSGRSGLEVATDILLNPREPVRVRSIAKRVGRSPSTVSDVVGRLREAHLIDGLTAVLPDLFWSLVPAWQPASLDVASLPGDDRVLLNTLKVGQDNGNGPGWALTDTPAAMIYGAPIALRRDYPPVLYVPDDATLRRAVQTLGPATTSSTRSATLRAAPVRVVSIQRVTDYSQSAWPLAHPLFVALDLAQDPGRGLEILSDWTPPARWIRVW